VDDAFGIVGQVVRIQGCDRRAIKKMVRSGEEVARERGFSPPFAG